MDQQETSEDKYKAQQRDDKRSAVLIEWERTCSPPQSEEVCLLVLFILLIMVLMFMCFIIYVAELSSKIHYTHY